MDVPSLFAGRCRSDNWIAWLNEHCASIDILGRAFPTYRLFIIFVGLVILLSVWFLLRYSRLGMIVRAGVQDSAMVEALGINIRRVFTMVFALGSALAALGGVVAAPFVGVYPEMGGRLSITGLYCRRDRRDGKLYRDSRWSAHFGAGPRLRRYPGHRRDSVALDRPGRPGHPRQWPGPPPS